MFQWMVGDCCEICSTDSFSYRNHCGFGRQLFFTALSCNEQANKKQELAVRRYACSFDEGLSWSSGEANVAFLFCMSSNELFFQGLSVYSDMVFASFSTECGCTHCVRKRDVVRRCWAHVVVLL